MKTLSSAFRMPDVMASAGAQLVEVGTTNRALEVPALLTGLLTELRAALA